MSNSFRAGDGIHAFIEHFNSLRPESGTFESLNTSWDRAAIPGALSDWLEKNDGPFKFEFLFEAEGEEYSGSLELDPKLFQEHRNECLAWADETWIAHDQEEKQKWLEAFPFAALGNGDFLALSNGSDQASVLCLAHDGASQVISPSLGEFITVWERLCYVGPDLSVFERFIDFDTGWLDADCDEANELRAAFQIER